MLNRVYHRLYESYFMRPRVAEFKPLLSEIAARGYEFLTIKELAECAQFARPFPLKTCVVRCDVDSDVGTARTLFESAASLDVKSTFYFRLSTLDRSLMREIAAEGGEAGYHFEEVATVAKRLGLSNRDEVIRNIDAMRQEFQRNVEQRYIPAAGGAPRTVASHGDFINRLLGVTNSCLIDDAIRAKFDIGAEVYDAWLNEPIDCRIADCGPPHWWRPMRPPDALVREPKVLYLLVHPKHWRANKSENLVLDISRIRETCGYALAKWIRQARSGGK